MIHPDPNDDTRAALPEMVGKTITNVRWEGYGGIVVTTSDGDEYNFWPTNEEAVQITRIGAPR